jgi:putative transposase
MKLYKSVHTVYKTQYHIVWITRYRRKILVPGVKSYLKIKLQEIRKYYPNWGYIKIGIKPDHIHLYMVIPPKYAVSMVKETIKKDSSRSLKQKVQLPVQGLLGPKRNLG